MEITREMIGNELTVEVKGKIDTNTSVQFRNEVAEQLDGVNKLVLDFIETSYISSAGMRVLLACQKTMSNRDGMIIKHVSPDIYKLFKATGMLELLNIEN